MGVATRGVKFKFSSGEKVLCYEPDPTKAKVLYESKVLDLVASRDDRGRKVPEYLIHFFGWNHSWDRCVREEFILPFTDENRELQTKLAKEAALFLKGKRKSKLPPLIKETLGKKFCSDTGDEKIEVLENPDSGSETNSSKPFFQKETEVRLVIPELLKQQLEEDRRCIIRKNKLVRLPCSPNVVGILETFVKHSLAKMLCVSPPRNGKKLMPDDVQNKLSLYKEAMDGIRVYFDFTLPHLLLYRQEKSQHAALCPPVKSFRDFLKLELLCEEPPPSLPARRLEGERGYPLQANVLPAGIKAQTEKVSKRKRGRPKLVPVRTLRSGVKARVQQLPVKLKGTPLHTLGHKAEPGEAPKREELLPGPSSSLSRVTRGSVLLERPPLPPPSFGCSSSHCKSSSESSGNETAVAGLQLLRNAGLLREMLEWRMLPPALCGQIPAAPSLVYGAQHLLRLFVKLPDLISKMNISSRKLQPLLSILEQLLVYLCEQRERLFPPSAYVDCGVK